LSATISAKVVDVLPSGNLAIEGKREIYINNEKKEILIQGVVRPRDIAYDNSVLSSQVADAKLIYTGIGVSAKIRGRDGSQGCSTLYGRSNNGSVRYSVLGVR